MCAFGSSYNVHQITNYFLNYSTFPTVRVILIFFKINFFSRVELFLGANVVFRCLFCFGSRLSKTDLIFLANIVSVGETASGVLGLGVILYTCRNCCSALFVGVPDAFLSARFNVSTKRSALPLRCVNVLYLEDFTELLEFDRCELVSVVVDHKIYYTEPRKQFM